MTEGIIIFLLAVLFILSGFLFLWHGVMVCLCCAFWKDTFLWNQGMIHYDKFIFLLFISLLLLGIIKIWLHITNQSTR